MCIRGLEECREKGEGAGVPEVRGGGTTKRHECTRMSSSRGPDTLFVSMCPGYGLSCISCISWFRDSTPTFCAFTLKSGAVLPLPFSLLELRRVSFAECCDDVSDILRAVLWHNQDGIVVHHHHHVLEYDSCDSDLLLSWRVIDDAGVAVNDDWVSERHVVVVVRRECSLYDLPATQVVPEEVSWYDGDSVRLFH